MRNDRQDQNTNQKQVAQRTQRDQAQRSQQALSNQGAQGRKPDRAPDVDQEQTRGGKNRDRE
jgi:hypothetical protein